jgi:NTE family protein
MPPAGLATSVPGEALKQPIKPIQIGLAISCGGAKGLAHVGVIQVLEENNIPIAAISGTSMGAYIGALWCAGYKGKQLQDLAEEIQSPKRLRALSDLAFPPSKGLFYGKKARAHLRKSIGDITFDRLLRPLYIISTDLETHGRVVCHAGKVIDAVHASCAMPGVIVPVHYQGHRCIDGGLVEPIPIAALHDFTEVDRVIAVSTIPSIGEVESGSVHLNPPPTRNLLQRGLLRMLQPVNLLASGNLVDTFNQALKASQIRMADDAYKHADLVIKPVTSLGRWYDYHHYDHFIQIGRDAAEHAMPQILELLNPRPQDVQSENSMVGKCLHR